jgi:hypothetical protein
VANAKNGILTASRKVYRGFKLCFDTVLSLIRVLLYSKSHTDSPQLHEMKKLAFVLGNGPSVRNLVDNNVQFLTTQNVVVVNDFFLNEHFTAIKPGTYVIADPAYWEKGGSDEMQVLRQKLQQTFLDDIDWDMLFFVPAVVYQTGYYHEVFRPNSFIHIRPFNTTPFSGPKRMRYFFYDKLLAKPFSGNVIGSALFIALRMDIREVLLFGVEHSWTRGLYVDDQNRTCIRNEHFYANNQQGVVWLKSNAEPYKIHEALFDIATMLGGYREINEYARFRGIRIYNCTPDSFIDAFDRKKWEKIN